MSAKSRALLCGLTFVALATVLLRASGEELVPIAEIGLSPDLLGRRFRVADHPQRDPRQLRRGASDDDLCRLRLRQHVLQLYRPAAATVRPLPEAVQGGAVRSVQGCTPSR